MIRVDCEKTEERFCALAEAAFELLSLSGSAVVEVDFVSEDEIRSVNAATRGVDKVTDVLSFPALSEIKPFTMENYPFETNENGEVALGNIIICEPVAVSQAAEYGHSVLRERCYLFTHGLMHLLGYDHIEDADKAVMREREEAVLARCGIERNTD